MLLVLILRGVGYVLVSRDVRELLAVVLGTHLVILLIAKGGHVDLMIQ
jgi:hypothetical protein